MTCRELRGQGTYRREAALAGLSRTDWEIAFHEATLAVLIARTFWTALYRREKLGLLEETVGLSRLSVTFVLLLVS